MNISNNDSNIGLFAEDDEVRKLMIDGPTAEQIKISTSSLGTSNDKDNTSSSSSTSTSYWRLVIDYPNYRYFLISYIVTQLGEWLTYVASLSILELAAGRTKESTSIVEMSSNTISSGESSTFLSGESTKQQQPQHHLLISILVVCRLIPTILSSFWGGILADTRDRKSIMFRLDICGGCVAIVYYIMAIQTLHYESDDDQSLTLVSTTSVVILFLCTIAQSTISGLYQPSRSSIVPMLVGEDQKDNIEKANEIATIIWSLAAAVGSSFGGFIVEHFGVATCFATDTIMYFTSAIILAIFVTGNYNVLKTSPAITNPSLNVISITNDESIVVETKTEIKSTATTESKNRTSSPHNLEKHSKSVTKTHSGLRGLLQEVRSFIRTHDSAPYLLIKGCGALLFGASDVINVTFAQNPETGVLDPQRLGYMFSAIGIGCLIGPIIMPPRRCYLSACIGSYFVLALGYGCMAWSKSFWWKCFWTLIRSSGTAVLWVDSSILLQTTTPVTLLGRISSIDFAIALLCEAASAMFAGVGQDYGMSAQQISFVLSGLGVFWGVIWTLATVYHRRRIHKPSKRDLSLVEMEALNMNP
jgi:MFS family permease